MIGTAFTASSVPSSVHNPRPDGTGHVWPHASHWTLAQEPNWGGYMDMGIHYIGIHGAQWLKETFLHELNACRRSNKFTGVTV